MTSLTRYHLSLLILFMISSSAHASSWFDIWKNTDQRAAAHLEQGQFDVAKQLFTRKDWQAVAAYRNKDYAAAEKGFQAQGGAEGFYNQGNALAFQGKYKQAIEAYQKTLKLEPKHLDAKHNLDVLEEMLKKNPPESKSDQSNSSDQPDKPEDSKRKQNKDHSNQENKPSSDEKQDGANNTPSQPDSASEKSPEQSPPESEQPSDESQEQPAEPEPKSESKSEADSKGEAKAKQDKQAQPSPQQANASATDAEQQAKEQWLRLIPDDPGGLLREKFWRDHMKRLQQRHV